MTLLDELQTAARHVVETAAPSVVGVRAGWRGACGISVGDGLVVTNAHAVRRGEARLRLPDGGEREASVVAVDPDRDLAVLRSDSAPPALAWRDEDAPVETGLPVFALAMLRGGGVHATFGLVSSTGRPLRGRSGRRVNATVEHSAPLPRGASGSALVDADGRLVGINSVRLDGGLILALSADRALRERIDALARGDVAPRVTLGVGIAPAHAARRLRAAVGLPPVDGLLVRHVEPGSAAAQGGL